MYPDLSYLIADLFGTPADNGFAVVKTFGLLLVFAFLASAYVLRLELVRKEKLGLLMPITVKVPAKELRWSDILSNTLIVFILAFKIPYVVRNSAEFKNDVLGILFSSKGDATTGIILSLLFLGWMYFRKIQRAKNANLISKVIRPADHVPDITIMSAVFGIIGAKLFVILENEKAWTGFLRNPIEQLFSGSGLAIYGGLIMAFIAVYFYLRKVKLAPIHVMDAAAPALIIGYVVGRMGCQLSGDGDWGIVNTLDIPAWWFLPEWMWAYDYPNTVVEYINPDSGNYIVDIPDCSGYVNAEGLQPRYCGKLAHAVFPTPIYESILGIVIFCVLWSLRKRIVIPGMLFFIYCILNGIERFWIEKIRVNDKLNILGIEGTQAEFISVLLVLTGVVGCLYLWRKNKS